MDSISRHDLAAAIRQSRDNLITLDALLDEADRALVRAGSMNIERIGRERARGAHHLGHLLEARARERASLNVGAASARLQRENLPDVSTARILQRQRTDPPDGALSRRRYEPAS